MSILSINENDDTSKLRQFSLLSIRKTPTELGHRKGFRKREIINIKSAQLNSSDE